jgi:hypothetical protein
MFVDLTYENNVTTKQKRRRAKLIMRRLQRNGNELIARHAWDPNKILSRDLHADPPEHCGDERARGTHDIVIDVLRDALAVIRERRKPRAIAVRRD